MMNHASRMTRVFFGFLLLGVAPALMADGGRHHRCSNWSVAGAFGYVSTGTRVGIGPIAAAGRIAFDEDGAVEGAQTVSFNGTIATETYAGTYSVNDDCTGSFTVVVSSSIPAFNRTSTLSVVWEDDSNAVHGIFTGAGTIITADARRIFTRGD